MAGITVSRQDLDMKTSRAVIALREGFENAAVIKGFLDQYPADAPGGDPLTNTGGGGFGYTEDEAYLIRLVFDQFDALNVEPILAIGRQLTGLE